MKIIALLYVLLMLPVLGFAQAADSPFQVGVLVANKNQDTVISVTNSGASATTITNGTLCANFYTFSSSNGSLLSCCSCPVAPNALRVISATNEFLPSAAYSQAAVRSVVKMMTSTGISGNCSGAASSVGTGSNVLATGIVLWTTGVLNYGSYADPGLAYAVTQNAFTPTTLSAAELTRVTSQCSTSPNFRNTCLACS